MHTMTMVSTGAFSTGRIRMRSSRRPPTKAMASVAKNASQ